ncbi:MAG: hypothetical protein MJZ26_11545, partial [Fibrobacter sp.]|nr:hypothetical protein [Fibrobacter sp.]
CNYINIGCCMKKFFMFIGIAASIAFCFCYDFEENIYDCIVQRTKSYPTYSDGTRKEVGQNACLQILKNKEYGDTIIQGIPVSIMYPAKPCRKIISITPKKSYREKIKKTNVDRLCCIEKTGYSFYSDNKYNHRERVEFELCTKGKGFSYYQTNPCLEFGVENEEVIEYEIVYSPNITYDFDTTKKPVYTFKQNVNSFMYNDTIELYRDDGTLKYKGIIVDNGNNTLSTKGVCYGADGIKEIRRTNNADFCK